MISTAFCALELPYPYLRLPFSNKLIHFRDGPALAPLRFHTIKEPPANKPSEIAAKNRCANPIDVLGGIIAGTARRYAWESKTLVAPISSAPSRLRSSLEIVPQSSACCLRSCKCCISSFVISRTVVAECGRSRGRKGGMGNFSHVHPIQIMDSINDLL